MINYDEVPAVLARETEDHAQFDPKTMELEFAVMNFNTDSAKGQVALVKSGYGAEIWVDGRPVGLIDLFYLAREQRQAEGYYPDELGKLHLQIDDPDYPDGDPLAHVYLYPQHTDLMIERPRDVEVLYDHGWPTLRYPREKTA